MRTLLIKKAIYQIGIALLIASTAAVFVNQVRSDGLPWVQARTMTGQNAAIDSGHISPRDALDMHGRPNIVFLDARSVEAFVQGHIQDARSLPYDPFATDMSARIAELPRDRTYIVYCDGRGCPLGDELAQLMRLEGLENVLVLSEGLGGWESAGGRVEP